MFFRVGNDGVLSHFHDAFDRYNRNIKRHYPPKTPKSHIASTPTEITLYGHRSTAKKGQDDGDDSGNLGSRDGYSREVFHRQTEFSCVKSAPHSHSASGCQTASGTADQPTIDTNQLRKR